MLDQLASLEAAVMPQSKLNRRGPQATGAGNASAVAQATIDWMALHTRAAVEKEIGSAHLARD